MRNVHRFGNEFWVEGDWTAAAVIRCPMNFEKEEVTFEVGYALHGPLPESEQRPYTLAILAACDYAKLCPDLFKGKTRDEVQFAWDGELRKFYAKGGLYQQWNPKRIKQ
jgi:hypothetical protein